MTNLSKINGIAFAVTLLAAGTAHAFSPVAPSGLDAKCSGVVVDLSWEWGNAGSPVSAFGFEGDEFPADCEVRSTAPEPEATWGPYSFEGAEETLAHGGDYAAILMMGYDDHENPSENHQDEWLVLKPGVGAVYMDFWYYLHPQLLDDGGWQAFPDHYYVQISRDNGASWTELWDGRWDMGNVDAVQQASLFLGEPTDENTLVAFNAVSAPEESLYYLWAVDDVEFLGIGDSPMPTRLKAAASADGMRTALKSLPLKRDFSPSASAARVNRAPQSEWLNNGLTTYRIYMNGTKVADYLKARHFTEFSMKEPGTYEYRVMAWNEAEDREYEAASVMVEVGEFEFGKPRNVRASYEEMGNGKYSVNVSWDVPASDLQPSHYLVYLNGKSIGWLDPEEQLSMGQSGLYKGIYTFGVEAAYEYPEGTSDRICVSVAPGTVYGVDDLRVTPSGNDRVIEWKTPAGAETAPVAYDVYRGDELIAGRIADCAYTDVNVPAGDYYYNVHAVYADGEVSLPVSASAQAGASAVETLPIRETFDNGHLPANWEVSLVDPRETVKDMYAWRFDNWFDIKLPADCGVEGGFASVSGIAAGMNKLETHLVTPPFEVTEEDGAILKYTKYYTDEKPGPSGAAQALLLVTADNGDTWMDIEDAAGTENGKCEIDLSYLAGSTVRVRWSFLSRNSGVFAIDNVEILTKAQNGVVSAVTSASDKVSVFTPDGIAVASGISRAGVSGLPAGLYIVVSESGATKVFVK